jgi:hypothetical protein
VASSLLSFALSLLHYCSISHMIVGNYRSVCMPVLKGGSYQWQLQHNLTEITLYGITIGHLLRNEEVHGRGEYYDANAKAS